MNNSNMVVMTKASIKTDKYQEVLDALQLVAEAARKQSGCLEYLILETADEPSTTMNFERWVSADERDAFNAGPDVQQFAAAVSGKFTESPQPVTYTEIN
jgi:quinol monooxygenase YgiN